MASTMNRAEKEKISRLILSKHYKLPNGRTDTAAVNIIIKLAFSK